MACQFESRKLIIASVLKSLKNMGFPIGDHNRLSVFNNNSRFYVFMGTIADIKSQQRSIDVENHLELAQAGDGWCLKLLVREPVNV